MCVLLIALSTYCLILYEHTMTQWNKVCYGYTYVAENSTYLVQIHRLHIKEEKEKPNPYCHHFKDIKALRVEYILDKLKLFFFIFKISVRSVHNHTQLIYF